MAEWNALRGLRKRHPQTFSTTSIAESPGIRAKGSVQMIPIIRISCDRLSPSFPLLSIFQPSSRFKRFTIQLFNAA